MEKKKFMVNCAYCDMRGIKEELLKQYDKIVINAATVFTSPRVQVLTAPYDVEINCASVVAAEEDAEIIQHNGSYSIKAGDRISAKKFILFVNGKVTIEAGTEEILKQCLGIVVNGKLSCPASVLTTLPDLKVNGKTESYPDGAVVVDSVFCPDSTFVLRAKAQSYFASQKVILTEEGLDVNALVQKEAHFITPQAVIPEKILAQAIPLFDDVTKIQVIKDGVSYLSGDVTLGENHLRKHGTRLFIDGNVRIEDEVVLKKLEFLKVNGTVRIKEALEQALSEKSDVLEYQELKIERGIWINDKTHFKVEPKLLMKDEVHICDVAMLTILPQVTEEQLLSKLKIQDCGVVRCSQEQYSAVEMISEDVGKITCGGEGGLSDLFALGKELLDTKVVNTGTYTF